MKLCTVLCITALGLVAADVSVICPACVGHARRSLDMQSAPAGTPDRELLGTTVLTFEGVGNDNPVGGFYGSEGITFSDNALGIVESDQGGSGNFKGEPTPDTILFFMDGSAAVITVDGGFTVGVSFYYAAANNPGSVAVYDGPDGSGTVLTTLDLPVTGDGAGNPACNGHDFCPFSPTGITFDGTAQSIVFSGVNNQIGFDDITFGSGTPDAGAGGDPWVEGYLGQHFYIEGPDAWYAAISTLEVQLNLKMTKFNDEAGQMYWTGAAVQHFAADGIVTQSLLVDTVDYKKAEVSCSDIGASSPCIGNGGITVTLNGVKQTDPAEFGTAKGHKFAAANLPYDCKHKTKTYIAEHPEEDDHRMLPTLDLQSFVVGRNLMNDEACANWMTENQDVFAAEGEHSIILFSAPSMTTALEYYKYAFEGQQYYRIDVSTINLQVKDVNVPQGIIGETLRPRFDAEGKQIMSGQVLKADLEHYIVEGPFGRDFSAKHLAEDKTFHLGGNN